MAVDIDKIRIGGSKVRTGCCTCKARRVKCDETRPACHRCVKAGRECGYLTLPEPTQLAIGHRFVHYISPNKTAPPGRSPSPSPSPHADLDSLALRSLDFFLNSTAPQLEQPFGSGTWSQMMTCLMQSQPAVKHGLIALAALHENYQHASRSVFADQRKLMALEHYGKSINGVVQINVQNRSEALGPTLVASLLFCAIESLQGHFFSAMKHINAGLRLLSECEDDNLTLTSLPSNLLDALKRLFFCLALQVDAIDDTAVRPVLAQLLKQSFLVTTCSFSTIEQAQTELALLHIDCGRLFSWTTSSMKEPGFSSHARQQAHQAHQALTQRFRCWSTLYHDLLKANSSLRGAGDHRMHLALLTLRLNQIVTEIMLTVTFLGDQMGYDTVTNEFEAVVSTAEEICRIESEHIFTDGDSDRPKFDITLGIVPAMFFVCLRCRHYSIRRRALSVLKMHQRRESVWDSGVTASVAEQAITIEEDVAARHQEKYRAETTSDCVLPESARIRRVDVDFLGSENTVKVSFLVKTGTPELQEVLVWDE